MRMNLRRRLSGRAVIREWVVGVEGNSAGRDEAVSEDWMEVTSSVV